jgi:hypothetical protein
MPSRPIHGHRGSCKGAGQLGLYKNGVFKRLFDRKFYFMAKKHARCTKCAYSTDSTSEMQVQLTPAMAPMTTWLCNSGSEQESEAPSFNLNIQISRSNLTPVLTPRSRYPQVPVRGGAACSADAPMWCNGGSRTGRAGWHSFDCCTARGLQPMPATAGCQHSWMTGLT